MTVKQIQCLLCYLGFDPGAPDGKLGPNTRSATRRFQAAAHLNVDGHPGPATQQALQEAVKKNFSTISDKIRQNQAAPQEKAQEAVGAVKENLSTNFDKNRQNNTTPQEGAQEAAGAVKKNLSTNFDNSPGGFWKDIRYFQRREFRCPCGRWCSGFPVEPKEGLVRFLEAMRGQLGRPVIVVPPDGHSGGSGVRCPRYNATLPGSVANSTHLTGRAADFSVPGAAAGAVEDYLARARAAGRIAYWYRIAPGSYHVNI